jgi:FlaA1/EpsC-like NDP-sugar epimerase
MDVSRISPTTRTALIGDVVVLAVLTVIGFASHATLNEVPRMVTTFVAFLVAWGLVAPWFGVYQEAILTEPRQVWRVALAWLAAAPLGALLRSVLLNRSIVDVTFVLVTIAINGLALVAWRALYAARLSRHTAAADRTTSPR